MIRIVLIDQADTSRYSLQLALQVYDDFLVTGTGDSLAQLAERYPEAQPDIVIISAFEIGLQELNLAYETRQAYPNAKIVLLGLTNLLSDEMLRNAGVNIFLPKTLSLEELVQTLQAYSK